MTVKLTIKHLSKPHNICSVYDVCIYTFYKNNNCNIILIKTQNDATRVHKPNN